MTAALDPRQRYLARAREGEEELAALERRSSRFSVWRGVLFIGGALAVLLHDRLPGGSWPWLGGGGLGLLAFVVLVRRHRTLRSTLRRVEAATDLARQGVARVERRWNDLPPPAATPADAGASHPYARDLDLYGRVSLRSLLGPVATPMGHAALDLWLLKGSNAAKARERQGAVRTLAGMTGAREAAAVEGALLPPVEAAVLARFLAWLRESPRVRGSVLDVLRWVLPLATLGLAVLDVVGVLPPAGWVAGLVAQAAVAWRSAPGLHGSFARASSGAPGLRRYHHLLATWEATTAADPYLDGLVRRLGGGGTGPAASASLRRLARLLDAADARLSGMLHPVLAVGVLWDLHVAARLEAWRSGEGARAPGWLETLGELEALSALATLAADHPAWAWPRFQDGEPPVVQIRGLGHPLLAEEVCVRNDVSLGPPGTVLLVTGSNMSGKSTLLRSVGAAVVLARAGGPVCAEELLLPPVRLYTSMRVEDSLEEGISLFMAELRRLQAILDAAPPREDEDAVPLLYLVDEMLHGTNSQERQAAGRRVIRHLLRRRALGAVTTHDLDLHRHPEVEAAARLVHFQESVAEGGGAPRLSFDYRLRDGLATTRNALLLAERMGITDPDEDGPQRTAP